MKEYQRIIALLICCVTILSSLLPSYGWDSVSSDSGDAISVSSDSGDAISVSSDSDHAINVSSDSDHAITASSSSSTVISFSDVKAGAWFESVVTQAAERKIVSGYPDGSFKPEKEVSYGEFLAMSMALEQITHEESPSHWAKGYYDHAVKMGYILSTDFSVSDLDSPIPRKDMALLMAGLIKARGLEITGNALSFSDVSQDDAYWQFIQLCSSAAVLSGYTDKSFRPEGCLRRCEAVAAIMNYIRLVDASITYASRVLEIDGEFYISMDDDGECWVGKKDFKYGDSPLPDPYEGIHPVNLMRDDQKQLLLQIMDTAKITGTPGDYTLTYTQPEIPARYHFAVDLTVYEPNAAGGSTPLFYKHSDAGWMSDRSKYDPSAQTVVWNLGSKVDGFTGRAIILTFEINDVLDELGNLGESAGYQYILEYDGSVQRVTLAYKYFNGRFRDYYRYESLPCPAFCW